VVVVDSLREDAVSGTPDHDHDHDHE
jgi:hypothetical protein